MPPFLIAPLAAAGRVLASMGLALLSEAFIKYLVVKGLEQLVKKTESNIDDDLLKAAKASWGMSSASAE